MRHKTLILLVIMALCGVVRGYSHTSVGLVLSGGGAKGIAHIGVLQALEDNDIPIDYITGTSMGSIVGGLYAAGYTPDEMMQLLLSPGFADWSTGKINPGETFFFSRQAKTPALYTISLAQNDSIAAANAVPASLISALPMNFAFMDLFAAYTAQCGGNFDRLFVPFRCVASDVEQNHKVVHRSGSLGDAIRTSMTFPIVFQPIRINGRLLYDGGIYDNFPVETMIEDFCPDFILGVDVSSSSKGPQTSILDQIDNLVIRPQSYEVPADRGIKMRINLDKFGLLDFPAAKKIYQIGYDHAMAMIDSIRGRVGTTVPAIARKTARAVFKSKTPYVRFDADSVRVTGGNADQQRYVRYLFTPAHADTFGINDARQSYYRAISSGRLSDLYPQAHYSDSTGLFNLDLHASVKGNWDIGLGGFVTSATNSFIFTSLGYNTLSLRSLSATLNGWVGQSYMAALINSDITLHTDIPSALGFSGLVSRQRYYETDRMFYDLRIPTFLISYEYYARLRYELAMGWRGKLQLSVGGARLRDTFFRTMSREDFDRGRDALTRDLGQVRLAYSSNTLNDDTYPTQGASYSLAALGMMGREEYANAPDVGSSTPGAFSRRHVQWGQFIGRTRNYFDVAKHFAFGLEGNVVLSSQKLGHNYNAAVISAPAFNPTPASYNSFNPSFRANNFAALSIVPIYKYNSSLSARLSLSGFLPFREILRGADNTARYGHGVGRVRYFCEADVCYTFPFATLSGYVNYASSAARHFNCGITFGLYITAPRFLQ